MMHFDRVFAVARAELRLTRRLVRFWVFLVVAGLAALLGYLQIGVVHGLFSTYSATISALSPRFMIGFLGLRYLLVFTIGAIFLGFDVRARDRRERMIEVLDSRPYSNLELLSGRFVALILAGWVPLVVLTLVVDGIGALLRMLQVPVGDTIEPVSLLAFTVFMALPAFAFAIGLVFLLTLLVRHRLVASVLLLGALGGLFWAVLRLPLSWGPLVDIWGAYMVDYPSDLIPGIADTVGWVQRFGVGLVGVAFLVLAAAVHPRLDGSSRGSRAGVGVLILAVGVALMGVGVNWRHADVRQLNQWREAHEAVLDEPAPDIETMRAVVTIDPGAQIAVDLDLGIRAPEDSPLESALFSLNPGLEVRRLADGAGRELEFTHRDGLLRIELPSPLPPGAEQSLQLEMVGDPDPRFGYLDSSRVPEELDAMEGAIYMLGYLRSINDSRYVALTPGSLWLPLAGPDVRRDEPRIRARDFFTVELEVVVPEGWLAAGPGARQELGASGDGARFRFAPGAPLYGVALMASQFESLSLDTEGVRCELLMSAQHLQNLQVLAAAESEIETAARELFSEAAENGLAYPYDGFTMVEVPNSLRGFAGGWRLGTAMAPPGMLLVRESGLPSARFDVAFRKPEKFQDQEGGMPRAMRTRLENFFKNDFSGGNLYTGLSRSFVLSETAAAGDEGLALNFAVEELSSLAVADTRGYFSAHIFDSDMGESIQRVMMSMRGSAEIADSVINALSSRPEVWDAVLEAPLDQLEPRENPERTLNVLTLKAGAMSQALHDTLGTRSVAEFLGQLRDSARGRSFDFDEFKSLAETMDPSLGPLLEDWLHTTELPAFVGVSAQGVRLPDAEDGAARYQITAEVRNDEPVPGFFRFEYRVGTEDDNEGMVSPPVRMGAQSTVRWGVVVSRPPQGVWVNPYLARNRETFRIAMAPVDEQHVVETEPFEGLESVDWVVPQHPWIAVDDLDEGFEVVAGEGGNGFRLLGRERDGETDGGLPVARPFRLPNRWSRAESATAWGRYRHTVAFIKSGKGSSKALFKAEIPEAGAWNLEIHLCHKQRFRVAPNWGSWKLVVRDENDSREVEFDAGAAPRGWNLVGSFEIPDGEVVVELSNESTGQVVVADAIRWVPAAARTTEG